MAGPSNAARSVDYVPRDQFYPFHCRDKRWAIIVAHRRAGKTVACVMELLTRALATSRKDARYAYIAPFREQAKTVAWGYLKHYAQAIVKDPEKDFRESELAVHLFNGSQVRLFGADNPNALRGMYLDGVVLDEYADMRPSLWGEVLRPALSDRRGWAVFIGTPRGRNSFFDRYTEAQSDPDWYALTLRASETGLLSPEELASARKTMTEAQYEQEYECSFEAAISGAIYAKELKRFADRVTNVPYDASRLVNTAWDIGKGDATAIWFYQLNGAEINVIDYFEDSGESAPYYAEVLAKKPYRYDTAFMPHDAENQQFASDKTAAGVIRANGFKVEVLPKSGLEEGINAARMLFSRVNFDRKNCERGLECLQHYRWAWNTHMDQAKEAPVHDWSSHGADAFRYLAMAQRKPIKNLQPIKYPKMAYV